MTRLTTSLIVCLAAGILAIVQGASAGGHEGGVTGGMTGHGSAPAPQITGPIKVEKATGPNACTVAEVYAKGSALDKKPAVVRGMVVKVSRAIMGKNWIHLRDGSGDEAKGTHKLVVTSQDLPSVGDVVTDKGTLHKDKDFGFGYRYEMIMEDATVTR